MGRTQIIAVILIFAGVLALVYGHFSYTKKTGEAKIGPLELEVKERKTVNVPTGVGVAAIAVGVFLLLARKKS